MRETLGVELAPFDGAAAAGFDVRKECEVGDSKCTIALKRLSKP